VIPFERLAITPRHPKSRSSTTWLVDADGHVIAGCLRFQPLAGEPPVAGELMHLDVTIAMPGAR
jgi:hypothetical protein